MRIDRRLGLIPVFALLAVIGAEAPAGASGEPYGWSASLPVGTVFTNGLNFLPVPPRDGESLRILSVTPLLDDGPALRVVGVLARVTPDMLPPDADVGWFESATGFPPVDHDAAGGVDPTRLTVRRPASDDPRTVELQIGYRVVAPGTSTQFGLRVRYELRGMSHEVTIPSHLTICAPATVRCAPEQPA